MYRTKTCGELNINNVNETVELAGINCLPISCK